jgi:hypothetical protein
MGRVYFRRFDQPEFPADQSAVFHWTADGTPRQYEVNLTEVAGFNGPIAAVRFDPAEAPSADLRMDLRAIVADPAAP